MEKEQRKKLYKLGLPIILGTILLIGVSYAFLSLTLRGTKTNVLKAGNLSLVLTDTMGEGINLTNEVPMYDEVGVTKTPYVFTLTNNGNIDSEYTIYLDDVTLESGEKRLPDSVIKYNLVRDDVSMATALLSTTGTNPNRVLETGVIAPGKTYTYDLRLWLDENATTAVNGQVFRGKIRVVASQVIQSLYNNENIIAAYAYDQTNAATKCITGEESTCQKATTYENGTIVHYQVNDSESYYFYVLHDDGDTLTMQQRENTTTSPWSTSGSITDGPTTAITTLENETADWDNVLDQTYTMGTTVFGNADNAFTECTIDYSNDNILCTTNTYTWVPRTGKARMITLQEALEQGCIGAVGVSCPIYMYNYLSNSTDSGGTVNAGSDLGYWTMSVYGPSSSNYPWQVAGFSGWAGLDGGNHYSTTKNIRAVVVIEK